MTEKTINDIELFSEIQNKAKLIKGSYSVRDELYSNLEDIYLVEAKDKPEGDHVKDTRSADPRNRLLGAMRLLTAAEPIWSVPYDDKTEKQANQIERFAEAAWRNAGRVRLRPVERDLVFSGLLYDECHVLVKSTVDMTAAAKTPAEKARAEAVAKRTPLMFEPLSPKICYPVFDSLGLAMHYSLRKMTVADVVSRWGEVARLQLGDKKVTDRVDYSEYWDMTYHLVWMAGQSEPLLFAEHKLPFIPIASVVIEGNEMLTEEDQSTRQPLLYATEKSGMWARQNLALTALYSSIFAIASNPTFVYQRTDSAKTSPFIDYSTPGGVVLIDAGESLAPLARNAIDPSLMTGLEIANSAVEQSTVFSSALGQAVGGGDAPFSLQALLSQAGRLPLVPYQRAISEVIGNAMQIGIELIREEGGAKVTAVKGRASQAIDLKAADIPDGIEIEASLDIRMPQDERQSVQIAIEGVKSGLFSVRYARENYLRIGQSDVMDEEIWTEQRIQALAAQRIQMEQQRAMAQMQMEQQAQQQRMQAAQQPPQPGPGMSGSQLPPGSMPVSPGGAGPQGLPPEMLQQMMGAGPAGGFPGAAQEGMPLTEPMNPENMPPEELGGLGGLGAGGMRQI